MSVAAWRTVKYLNGITVFNVNKMETILFPPIIHGVELFVLPPDHPAFTLEYETFGLKTFVVIPKGTTLGYYGGIYYPNGRWCPPNRYLMANGTKVKDSTVDALLCGNEFRYINDFTKIHKRPNVDMGSPLLLKVIIPDAPDDIFVTPLVTLNDIAAGDELTMNYGKGYWTVWGKQLAKVEAVKVVEVAQVEVAPQVDFVDEAEVDDFESFVTQYPLGSMFELKNDHEYICLTLIRVFERELRFRNGKIIYTMGFDEVKDMLYLPVGSSMEELFDGNQVEIYHGFSWRKGTIIVLEKSGKYLIVDHAGEHHVVDFIDIRLPNRNRTPLFVSPVKKRDRDDENLEQVDWRKRKRKSQLHSKDFAILEFIDAYLYTFDVITFGLRRDYVNRNRNIIETFLGKCLSMNCFKEDAMIDRALDTFLVDHHKKNINRVDDRWSKNRREISMFIKEHNLI